jgi:ribonuclease P protein component
MKLPSLLILKKRREFVACAASGKKFVRPTLVLQMRVRGPEDVPYAPEAAVRAGFTCTKTLGNAVVRNRIKRRLRAAAAQILPLWGRAGHDYVLIGRGKAKDCPYSELLDDLAFAVKRLR